MDHFKNYNDKYGHPAGDKQLKKFTRLLKEKLRGSDFCARTGGEEFAILCPETEKSHSQLLAERIRVKIQKELNQTTISAGIAEFPTDAKNIVELVEKSDQALYRAKEKRNCTVCFED